MSLLDVDVEPLEGEVAAIVEPSPLKLGTILNECNPDEIADGIPMDMPSLSPCESNASVNSGDHTYAYCSTPPPLDATVVSPVEPPNPEDELETVVLGAYWCVLCNKPQRDENIDSHISTHLVDVNQYECLRCNELFADKDQHIRVCCTSQKFGGLKAKVKVHREFHNLICLIKALSSTNPEAGTFALLAAARDRLKISLGSQEAHSPSPFLTASLNKIISSMNILGHPSTLSGVRSFPSNVLPNDASLALKDLFISGDVMLTSPGGSSSPPGDIPSDSTMSSKASLVAIPGTFFGVERKDSKNLTKKRLKGPLPGNGSMSGKAKKRSRPSSRPSEPPSLPGGEGASDISNGPDRQSQPQQSLKPPMAKRSKGAPRGVPSRCSPTPEEIANTTTKKSLVDAQGPDVVKNGDTGSPSANTVERETPKEATGPLRGTSKGKKAGQKSPMSGSESVQGSSGESSSDHPEKKGNAPNLARGYGKRFEIRVERLEVTSDPKLQKLLELSVEEYKKVNWDGYYKHILSEKGDDESRRQGPTRGRSKGVSKGHSNVFQRFSEASTNSKAGTSCAKAADSPCSSSSSLPGNGDVITCLCRKRVQKDKVYAHIWDAHMSLYPIKCAKCEFVCSEGEIMDEHYVAAHAHEQVWEFEDRLFSEEVYKEFTKKLKSHFNLEMKALLQMMF